MQSVYDIADVRRLTPENARIVREGDFPVLYLTENGVETRVGTVEVKRAFPFETPEEFLVLIDEEGRDRGFIRDLAERSEAERELLRSELSMRYFMPVIRKIKKVNDRYGYSYWSVDTDSGSMEFTVKDPYKSIIRLGERMIITDADGNRFDLPDVSALPRKDKRKIELYLR